MRMSRGRALSSIFLLVTPVLWLGAGCADNDEYTGPGGSGNGGSPTAGGDGGAGSGGKSGGASGGGGMMGGGDAGSAGRGEGGEGGEGGEAGSGGQPAVVGDTYALTSAVRLVLFNRASGAVERALAINNFAGEQLLGIDIRPANKKIYVLAKSGNLYTLDPETGVATLASTLAADPGDASSPFAALSGSKFGLDFNPVADRLRVVSDTGQNLRINVDTGATFTDTALTPSTSGATGAAYTNSFASACRTALYVIDTTSRKLMLQSPPNDGVLTAVGDLGLAQVTVANGFEIVTNAAGANQALALIGSSSDTKLYDIDLATGTASNPRPFSMKGGEQVLGLSAVPPETDPVQARGELAGVSISNRLVTFERSAPGKLCTSAAISGMGAAETVLGIDQRPADGALYALGSSGKLYTLNLDSAAATVKSMLTADAADVSDAFTALSGTNFGVGFNPVPDRLRVVSDTGQNLRINVDTGAVTTDATLTPGVLGASAVAYTNSFAGAKSTTLFALAGGSLARIGGDPATGGACPADVTNPNCGIVTPVSSLGLVGVAAVDGFDIDPRTGATGSALAAISLGAASTSSLYDVDLATGVASAPAGVANATIGGGERLRGLALLANPTISAFGIAGDRLVGFSLATPGVLTRDLAITGLQASEVVLGIDFRPLDGALYAVGSSGRLYSLDPSTGAATERASLSAAVGDDDPFVALKPGAAYGVDFNPAADLLRAVSDAEDNLRIVPSARTITVSRVAGATFTDAPLSPGDPSVVATAYSNNYAGATTTTLYSIDSLSNELLRQGGPDGAPSPNGGVLTSVGALGIDAVGDLGFDIVGGRDGLALAAIRTTGTSSELYTVNLATGAATAFNAAANTVGVAGSTPALRALAVQLK
jgi:hypothetical protein